MFTGGSDAVYCKMLMSILSGTTLEWFISLPDGHITSLKSGFLKNYLQEETDDQTLVATGAGQGHEVPIHAEVNTISGGFPRRECAPQTAVVSQQTDSTPDVDLVFTQADLQGVVPHDNDPMVISLIAAGRRVRHVLVDEGSLTDVMLLKSSTVDMIPLAK